MDLYKEISFDKLILVDNKLLESMTIPFHFLVKSNSRENNNSDYSDKSTIKYVGCLLLES